MNQVIILGNLGQDPEFIQGKNQDICKLSVATTSSWTDKRGDKQEETEWHRVVFFGKQADIVDKYFEKGMKILVVGKIKYGSYEDKDGTTRYTTDIIGERFEFVGGAGDKDRRSNNDRDRRSDRDNRGRRDTGRDRRDTGRDQEPEDDVPSWMRG